MYQESKVKAEIKAWHDAGEPVPPPHRIKQEIVGAYATLFEARVLIETGTFLGDMLNAMKSRFDKLISIELSKELADKARLRFKQYPKIQIVQGDSGEMLQSVLKGISQRTVFWLDGHYSGDFTAKANIDTPIVEELRTVFGHPVKDHVILIDDARLFNGTDDYPTIEEIKRIVDGIGLDYECSVRNDVIRIHPRKEGLRLDV
jgi:hypothetical protein